MECLALMAKSPRPGHLLICGAPPTPKDLARQTRGTQAEVKRLLDELTRHGVCSWTDDKILFSRRMVRDAERSARNVANGSKGGNPALLDKPLNGSRLTDRLSESDKPHIPEARSQKDQEPDLHTRPKAAKTPRPRRDEPEEFSRFWSAYPRHTKRPNAVRAWIAQQPDLGKVLEALSWQTQQPDWTKQGGRFVPYPASWLNARQWEDEPFHTPAFEDESEAFARVARGEGKL